MAATEPIRDKKQVRAMAEYYLNRGNLRNYLLVILGVHTALRISDLLALNLSDVYDFNAARFKTHIHVTERKTKKSRAIALNAQAIGALKVCFGDAGRMEPDACLFPNNRKNRAAISRVQAYRIIRAAAEAVRLMGRISCHSLRKTLGYHLWKEGVPVTVIMDIYNHTSYEVTRRYLGVSQDDRDKAYLALRF